jgi:hypothetical protein
MNRHGVSCFGVLALIAVRDEGELCNSDGKLLIAYLCPEARAAAG